MGETFQSCSHQSQILWSRTFKLIDLKKLDSKQLTSSWIVNYSNWNWVFTRFSSEYLTLKLQKRWVKSSLYSILLRKSNTVYSPMPDHQFKMSSKIWQVAKELLWFDHRRLNWGMSQPKPALIQLFQLTLISLLNNCAIWLTQKQ